MRGSRTHSRRSTRGGAGGRSRRGQFRIIAGKWRGRVLRFPEEPGLRPSPQRVRETLFNWLQPVIAGARCLDLFAGSGALGLEALSRGAGVCVFVDRNREVAARLEEHLRRLGAGDGRVVFEDSFSFLAKPGEAFDIVFLDPPFGQSWLPELCTLLEKNDWLSPEGRVYLESGRTEELSDLPANWRLHRSRKAGQVAYGLAVRHAWGKDR